MPCTTLPPSPLKPSSCVPSTAFFSALPEHITKHIMPFCVHASDEKTAQYTYIKAQGIATLSTFLDISFKEAMIYCLESHLWPARFVRNKGLFTPQEQKQLLQSHVAVMGCGGLGGATLVALTRLGIGSITCCDNDYFDETNLNRQAFCTETTINKQKVLVAKQVLNEVASYLTVNAHHITLTPENLPALLHNVHVAVDCLDNFPTRFALEQACVHKNIPFIHGALAGLEGFAMTCTAKENHLSTLYNNILPKEEEKTPTPTPTPTVIGHIQSLLVVENILKRPFFTINSHTNNLLHIDLSIPEIIALQLKPTS